MDIQITQEIYTAIDEILKSTLLVGISKVMIGLGALIGTFWTLSLVMRSLQWLWMGMTQIFREVVFELLKMAFIVSSAFNIEWYWSTIVPFVTQAPLWIGANLSGQDGTQLNQVDSMIKVYTDNLIQLYSTMNVSFKDMLFGNVGSSIQTIVLYALGGIPFLASAVITLFVTKAALTMLLVLGPLFIIFALFEKTAQWFYGWVSIVAGFMLTQVLFSICLALQIGIVNKLFFKGGEIDISLSNNLKMLLCFWAFTALSISIPAYAGSITGAALGSAADPGKALGAMKLGALGAGKSIGKFGGAGKNLAKRFFGNSIK